MSRAAFDHLVGLLSSMAKQDSNFRKCIPLEKRVAIALFTLGSSAEYRTVGRLFGVSSASVCKIFKEFCLVVWRALSPDYLPPDFLTHENVEECVEGFQRLGFPQCFGAIGW